MRKIPALLALLLTGCSTAPVADLMDLLYPGRLAPGTSAPYGGVCLPQGGPVAPAPVPAVPGVPGPAVPLPPPPPGAPGAPAVVVPPPAPAGPPQPAVFPGG